jgi:hypothetical protein
MLRIRNTGINEDICDCADEVEAGGSEDYPHLQGEEENTLEDSKEDETADGKGDQFVPLFRITIVPLPGERTPRYVYVLCIVRTCCYSRPFNSTVVMPYPYVNYILVEEK